MNCEGCVRKRSWPIRGTIPEFAHTYQGYAPRTSVRRCPARDSTRARRESKPYSKVLNEAFLRKQ
jgi:hypothetical protein